MPVMLIHICSVRPSSMALKPLAHAQFVNMFQWLNLCTPLAINSANTQAVLKILMSCAKWKKSMANFGFTSLKFAAIVPGITYAYLLSWVMALNANHPVTPEHLKIATGLNG
jgi:hypothetical protein